MDKRFNLFISAFISIGIYVLIILLLIMYEKSTKVNKFNLTSKDTILELDLIIDKKDNIKNKSVKVHKVKNSKKVVKKSTAISAKKKTNLKSLFASVSTKSTNIKNVKVLNIRSNHINSRFKSKYQKQKKNNNIKNTKLFNFDNKTKVKKINFANNKGNYDEYYSKINNIILTRWYNYPLFIQNNYLVSAEITIDDKGKFSYYIMSYSNNLIIDNAVKLFLNNETSKVYPVSPDGQRKIIRINFKPESKDIN